MQIIVKLGAKCNCLSFLSDINVSIEVTKNAFGEMKYKDALIDNQFENLITSELKESLSDKVVHLLKFV